MDKELAKLLARLTALKNNLPSGRSTPVKYVSEFNSIITEIEKSTEEKLDEFKIPFSEIRPQQISSRIFTDESFCDREFLLMKIDGVLGYFTLLLQPADIKNRMGFSVEEKE